MKEKISFLSVNKNNYTTIDKKDINDSRIRIDKEIKKFKRNLVKNQYYE